jgi:hypothetical protein
MRLNIKKNEWQVLCCVVGGATVLPQSPPSMKQAVLLIAKLGGFLARKHDYEPGVKVIWRGLKVLGHMVKTWYKALSLFSPNAMGNV